MVSTSRDRIARRRRNSEPFRMHWLTNANQPLDDLTDARAARDERQHLDLAGRETASFREVGPRRNSRKGAVTRAARSGRSCSSEAATRSAVAVATARAGKAGAAVLVYARCRSLVGEGRMHVPAQKQESCCYAIDGRRLRRGRSRLLGRVARACAEALVLVRCDDLADVDHDRSIHATDAARPATRGRRRSRPGRRRPSALVQIR